MARVDSSRASSQACESGVPGVSHSSTGWGSSTLRWYGGGDGGPVGWGKETTTVAEVGCLCIRENVAEGKEATENLGLCCPPKSWTLYVQAYMFCFVAKPVCFKLAQTGTAPSTVASSL